MFRFIGSEGTMVIDGNKVIVSRKAKAKEPGYTITTFTKATQTEFLREYRAKYPERDPEMSASHEETHAAPGGYSDQQHHLRNFIAAVRTRKPIIEDPVFGFRAAGPAAATNLSYFDNRPMLWDPESMTVSRA
jgi:hypothetical protein